MHAHFPRRTSEYNVMEFGDASRFNSETSDPFQLAVVAPSLDISELIDRMKNGPEHEDYITRAWGPVVEKMVCIFACDCNGPRTYNIHVYARALGDGGKPGPSFPKDYGPGRAPGDLAVAMLIIGAHSVTYEHQWYRCPLDLAMSISDMMRPPQ